MSEKGYSGRALSAAAGLTKDVGRLLYKGDKAWTLPELEQVCDVLDTEDEPVTVSGVVADGEGIVEAESNLARIDERRARKADVSRPPQTPAQKVAKRRAKRKPGQPEAESGEA